MERIQYLVRQYLDGRLTPEELEEFNLLFEDEAAPYREADWEPLLGKIMARADAPEPAVLRIGARRWRWMAAAAVLLIAGGVTWLLERGHGAPAPEARALEVVAHDANPGSSKAVLTLADGKTMALDAAHNGLIGRQGGEELVSRDSQLIYQGAGGDSSMYNMLTTPRGGQYCVILPDGTKAWLNADSYLRYPTAFHGKSREVELRGEGYFEVAARAGQPFRINVLRRKGAPMQVDVLGTHFNIMDYDDEPVVRTTLLEGAVRVSKGGAAVVLRPGQAAWLEGEDRLSVHTADVEEAVAWKNGLFKFDGATMAQVMRQLSRWYDLDVEYVNGVPGDLFQGEMYRDVRVSEILKILEASGVHFTVEGKRLLVK